MKDRAKGRKTCKKGRIVAKNGQNIYNKSMKKVISVALVAILIVTTALTFTGCIFNTGDGKTYNYADKFDYYLLVLYKGGESEKTGKVILKPVGGEETSYDVHFTLEFDEEKSKVVKKVIVKDFRLPTYGDSTGTLSFEEPAEVSFVLYPKREDLTYRITPSKIEDGKWKFSKNLLEFNKISSRTSDKKIERAKKKQTNFREKRGSTSD